MKHEDLAIRVPESLLLAARKLAEIEGIDLDDLIASALADRLSAISAAEFFKERAKGADLEKARAILERAGRGNPPIPGDEIDN